MPDRAAVETNGLVKRFGETLALDDVSLRVEAGSVHGLLGRNGAGKTTLLRVLFGLVRPDAGSVRLFEREAGAGDVAPRLEVAGFVEEPRFYPYLSVRRNLELLRRLDGSGRAEGVDEALEVVGLSGDREERVGNLSTGTRQRLGLAAALLRAPKLLLLDEPTIGLDPSGARDVRELVRELARRGATVFLSSHNMGEVDEICDAVVVIHRGRVVWDGTLERLRAEAPSPAYTLSTSDDARAVEVGRGWTDLEIERGEDRRLTLHAEDRLRDDFVLALAREGVAVRMLEPAIPALDALFASLTRDDDLTVTSSHGPQRRLAHT